jgi:glycosyltransferase involved in cell wall biosynthesis
MTAAPQVSVVVIAFREARRIGPAIRSILAQEGAPTFEIVLVDDGSPDATIAVAVAAAASDPRLRVVALPVNGGRGVARSAGVEAAGGRDIAFVDADITLPPDWLARCAEQLPGHAAVGGIAIPDGDAAVVARISGAACRPIRGTRVICGANVLFDGSVLRSIVFPMTRLGEDFRLITRLEKAGHRFANIGGLVVDHREDKSYGAALRWLYASGADAVELLAEFGIVRSPDISHAVWLAAAAASVAGALLGHPAAVLLWPAATIAIALAHAATRFLVWPQPLRFVAAAILDVPAVTAYLLGRTAGCLRLGARLLRR